MEFHQAWRRRLQEHALAHPKLAEAKARDREGLATWLRGQLNQLVSSDLDGALSRMAREVIVERVIDELTGLGPLEVLLADAAVTEIMVGTDLVVHVVRSGRLIRTSVHFDDAEHAARVVQRAIDEGLTSSAGPGGSDLLHIERRSSDG